MPPALELPGALTQLMVAPLNPSSLKAKPTGTGATQTRERERILGAGAWEDAHLELAQRAGQHLDLPPLHGKSSLEMRDYLSWGLEIPSFGGSSS